MCKSLNFCDFKFTAVMYAWDASMILAINEQWYTLLMDPTMVQYPLSSFTLWMGERSHQESLFIHSENF